jgi:spore coat polysaccharide biosynthesis protein SpsF
MTNSTIKHPVVTAIIQARMGSSRLPGKMTLSLYKNINALSLLLKRISLSKTISHVIVATTEKPEDDCLSEIAKQHNVDAFRGSENDVLDRYYQAAQLYPNSDAIIRLTGDCPLHDVSIIDAVVNLFFETSADYASNIHPPTYPDGIDVEVIHPSVLKTAWKEAKKTSEREHVTPFIHQQKDRFKCFNLQYTEDLSHLRLTLDETRDHILLSRIVSALYPQNSQFTLEDTLTYLKENPELLEINSDIQRNEGLLKSQREDTHAS